MIKDLKIGGDIGLLSNTDPKAKTTPAFFLLGGSYKLGKCIKVDAAVKFGLNGCEADHALIGGVTLNF